MFSLIKIVKNLILFLGKIILNFYAWFFCYFTYLPFVLVVYVVGFGIDYHKLPSLKEFRTYFTNGVKSLLFLNENLVRKVGYYFVLPFLKSAKEDENPVTSMFSKYFNASMNNQKLTIAHEYIDSIHRKNSFFTIVTFLGIALIYFFVTLILDEVLDLFALVGYVGIGGSAFAIASGGVIASIVAILTTVLIFIAKTTVSILITILTIDIFLLIIWCIKEVKTQQHLNSYIEESLQLMVSTLKNNFSMNEEVLQKIEDSRYAVLVSSNPNLEFKSDLLKINLEANNFKRLI